MTVLQSNMSPSKRYKSSEQEGRLELLSNETAVDRSFTNIRKHSGTDLLPIDLMLDAKMSQVAVCGGCVEEAS